MQKLKILLAIRFEHFKPVASIDLEASTLKIIFLTWDICRLLEIQHFENFLTSLRMFQWKGWRGEGTTNDSISLTLKLWLEFLFRKFVSR